MRLHKHMHIIESVQHEEDLYWPQTESRAKEITLQQWCNLFHSTLDLYETVMMNTHLHNFSMMRKLVKMKNLDGVVFFYYPLELSYRHWNLQWTKHLHSSFYLLGLLLLDLELLQLW